MAQVAVIVHTAKRLGRAGPEDLHKALAEAGVDKPMWYEVPKSKKAAKPAREAAEAGADLLLVWGGDGLVRRCIDALAGGKVAIGILPAGTANLLANGLGIPIDLPQAIDVALHGRRRTLDVGVVNDERFAVMAGTGFDAVMIAEADSSKARLGRLAYVRAGLKAARVDRVQTTVTVDGQPWFQGETTCCLIGNLGTISGGLVVFERAEPDDGRLEIGVTTADGPKDWARLLTHLVRRKSESSPFVRTTSGREFVIELAQKVPWELDGGDRKPTKRLDVRIEPAAIEVCCQPSDG